MIAFSLLVVFALIGIPIAFAIGLATTYFLSQSPFPLVIFAQRTFAGLDSFALLAVPLFILAGEIMNESGITNRIINTATAFVGHWRAGLAHVNIWSSVLFAGVSGSAIADTAALGRVFIPEMEKQGYGRSFAAALCAAAAVIGPIIPPSIPVIIYALIASGTSVPALFLAGVIPGLLCAAGLSAYMILAPSFRDVGKKEKQGWRQRLHALRGGLAPIFMPVFIIGAIVGGITTPTEAAALAALYALLLGVVFYRTIPLTAIPGIFARAMKDSAVILFIIGVVAAGNWALAISNIPQEISHWVLRDVQSPLMFLLLVNILLLIVGALLEGIAAMLVLVPIIHPIALQMGIDPTQFGLMVVFNLMLGLLTPPMGLCLFVADSIAGVGISAIVRKIIPLFIVELIVLAIVALVPAATLALPHLFGYG